MCLLWLELGLWGSMEGTAPETNPTSPPECHVIVPGGEGRGREGQAGECNVYSIIIANKNGALFAPLCSQLRHEFFVNRKWQLKPKPGLHTHQDPNQCIHPPLSVCVTCYIKPCNTRLSFFQWNRTASSSCGLSLPVFDYSLLFLEANSIPKLLVLTPWSLIKSSRHAGSNKINFNDLSTREDTPRAHRTVCLKSTLARLEIPRTTFNLNAGTLEWK